MKHVILTLSALVAAASASAQEPGGRVAVPGPNPEWAEVQGGDGTRVFVERRSIRLENGSLRYIGRIVNPRPDEHGVLELVHVGEINCARRDYRTVAFDALGASGEVLASYTVPPEEGPIPINSGSNNEALHAEFCR